MGRAGSPTRLAPGIYVLPKWIRVTAKVAGVQREAHFPLKTDLREMQRWQLRTKDRLLDQIPARAPKGTLAAAAPDYLATLTGRRRKDDQALMSHWVANPLGRIPRHQITRAQVKAQLAAWAEANVAASTINHRLRVLRNLYRELDGDQAPNPTDTIRKLREPEPENRSHSLDLIEAIIAWMPDRGRAASAGMPRGGLSMGKARARVMLWTGLPPAQLQQIRLEHVDFLGGTLRVMPRRKGGGTKAVTIPLLPEAINALKVFFAAKANGRFSTSSFYKQWMRAQARLLKELRRAAIEAKQDPSSIRLPRRIRPYDLRHTFGAHAYRASRNLVGVKKLMLHARLSTTERYVEGVVDESAAAVIQAWGEVPAGASGG